MLAAMPPDEAKRLTESLASRFEAARALGKALSATESAAAQNAPGPAAPAAKAGD